MSESIRSKGKQTQLDVAVLMIPLETQRALNSLFVKKLISNFDPDKFGQIVVSHRGGKYYVVDGQHRVEAVREMGWKDQKLPCLLYEDMTLADEAELWGGLQNRHNARAVDRFKIAIVAGREDECNIERIVKSVGLAICDQRREGAVCAVAALLQVYKGAGLKQSSGDSLARTLRVLRNAWGFGYSTFEGPLILGMGLVIIRYGREVDEEVLSQKLSKVKGGPSGMIGRAKQLKDIKGGTVGRCMAACIVDVYNSGRRTGKLEDFWS